MAPVHGAMNGCVCVSWWNTTSHSKALAGSVPSSGSVPVPGVIDRVASRIGGPGGRSSDRRDGREVGGHRQRGARARRIAVGVGHFAAIGRGVVGELRGGDRVGGRRRAADVRAVLLPLIGEGRRPGGADLKVAESPDGDEHARRIFGDRRRGIERVLDAIDAAGVRARAARQEIESSRRARRRGRPATRMPLAKSEAACIAARGVQRSDPAGAVVGEEVVADVGARETERVAGL